MSFLSFFSPEEVFVIDREMTGLDEQGAPIYEDVRYALNAFIKVASSSTTFIMNAMDKTLTELDLIFDSGIEFSGTEFFEVRGKTYKMHGTPAFSDTHSITNNFLDAPVVVSVKRTEFPNG